MPPGRPWKKQGPPQHRHGPYTQIHPAPKKAKPQQEHQCFKVQALSQLDAIADEGLRAVNAELTTMALARNQQIWLRLDQRHSRAIADEQPRTLLGDGPNQPYPEDPGSNEHVGSVATQECRQVASVPTGGDPPLSDGRGTQSGALLCEQKWRLPACVVDGPS